MSRNPYVTIFLGLGLLGVILGAAGAWLSSVDHLADVVAMFAAPALTSTAIGLVLSLLVRRWRYAAGYLAAGLALLLFLQPQWFPKHPPAEAGARPIRIYFSNVWAQNDEIDAMAASVAAAKADVVAMVEVTDGHAQAMDRILAGYPHRLSTRPARFFSGGPRVVVASRWPIEDHTNDIGDGLAVGDVTIRAPSGPLRLITAHLTRPWPLDGRMGYQRDQTRRLANRVRFGEREHVVLVGDFNATASSDTLRDFAADAKVTPARAVTGTWIHPLPGVFRIAIDNAFTGPGLAVTKREIGKPNGSDHRPIIVEVKPAAR